MYVYVNVNVNNLCGCSVGGVVQASVLFVDCLVAAVRLTMGLLLLLRMQFFVMRGDSRTLLLAP